MAEFTENCGLLSPTAGDQAGEEDGKSQREVAVSNGDCGGLPDPSSGPGTDKQALEAAPTSVVSDPKSGLPRKTSIIKVNVKVLNVTAFCLVLGHIHISEHHQPRPDTTTIQVFAHTHQHMAHQKKQQIHRFER